MYGITETTVHVTYRPVMSADLNGDAGSLIGRAIPDLRLYVLDPHMQPVAVGVPGELHVGGAGLARNYLHRPALTAERFVPDSLSRKHGERLYKTGDLVRYLPDGDIEYLGRVDQQVKIRGFRIELGEIESVLSEHPAVREAVLMVGEDAANEKRIVAYVVGDEARGATDYEMRRFIAERLPEYMLPSAFVLMEALPLTANGKVDRNRLPSPVADRPELGTYVEPRTPLEEILVGIWCDVLGIDQVGVYDNFFDLGGHSIMATQLASRLSKALEVELSVRHLFLLPTIAELATEIEDIFTREIEELSDEEAERLL
jgi:acyl-CoA synthetase (AMP-forming)/AMP-acid ligase II/acyl carrier protein